MVSSCALHLSLTKLHVVGGGGWLLVGCFNFYWIYSRKSRKIKLFVSNSGFLLEACWRRGRPCLYFQMYTCKTACRLYPCNPPHIIHGHIYVDVHLPGYSQGLIHRSVLSFGACGPACHCIVMDCQLGTPTLWCPLCQNGENTFYS